MKIPISQAVSRCGNGSLVGEALFRPGDSFLNRIMACNFDGSYLDIIDAFGYFE